MRTQGFFGLRVEGSGLGVEGLGARVYGLGLRWVAHATAFWVLVSGDRGSGFRTWVDNGCITWTDHSSGNGTGQSKRRIS